MPQNKSYAQIQTCKDSNMQTQRLAETPQKQQYLDSIIQNLKLQYPLSQIDLIVIKLQNREQYLFNLIVYSIKNNLPSGVIYARELQQIRTLKTKILSVKDQLKTYQFSLISAKKIHGEKIVEHL
jgi:division protein CdvB (Snf7/Vps24/ESCRT-III family)